MVQEKRFTWLNVRSFLPHLRESLFQLKKWDILAYSLIFTASLRENLLYGNANSIKDEDIYKELSYLKLLKRK